MRTAEEWAKEIRDNLIMYHKDCRVDFFHTSKVADAIDALAAERDDLLKQLSEKMDEADKMAHVIIESDFPDGNYCKCEVCCEVARKMDSAGWCERAEERWWKEAEGEEEPSE